jgi:hypothetical protein
MRYWRHAHNIDTETKSEIFGEGERERGIEMSAFVLLVFWSISKILLRERESFRERDRERSRERERERERDSLTVRVRVMLRITRMNLRSNTAGILLDLFAVMLGIALMAEVASLNLNNPSVHWWSY